MTMHPAAVGQFKPTGTYLDTAAYGLPPRATVEAMTDAIDQWQTGIGRWPVDWDPAGEECRTLLASIIGASPSDVALVPAVSVGVAIAASLLKPGDEVVVPEDEFASLLLPLVVAANESGAKVRRVPFEDVPAALSASTALVATSHVRSNGGGLMDLDKLMAAAGATATPVLLDATHSAGVLQIEMARRGIDIVVAAGYKHLLCPRGVGLLAIAPHMQERIAPLCASWRAQSDPYDDYFGGGLDKLAPSGLRFDVSLAWFSWVGARASLSLLDGVPAHERQSWCVGLADGLADVLQLRPTGSSIVSVPVRGDRATIAGALDTAQLRVSQGHDSVRVSFHLYNGPEDVDRAATVLAPLRDPRR